MFSVIIIISLFFGIDLYAWQAVKTAFLSAGQMNSRWAVFGIYWGLNLLLPLILFFGIFEMRKGIPMNTFLVWIGNIWFALLITKIIVLLILFSEDLFRLFSGTYQSLFQGDSLHENNFLPDRRKFLSQLAIGVAAVPFASFIYGMVQGRYNYKVHRHILSFKDLPEAFDGFTITQISDVHAGSFSNAEGVEAGIKLIEDLKSDLFVFTGDLINTYASEMDPWLSVFKRIKAPYGQFSVLGNHDYGEYAQWNDKKAKQDNFQALLGHHQNLDFTLLRDQSVPITKDGQTIHLLGVENWGKGFGKRGDLEKSLVGIPENGFKILLSHDPSHWNELVKDHPANIHLTLSGHTHGMQMGIEIPGLRWSPIKYRYPQWAGLYNHNEKWINVNRGFGVLGFRGRVGIWPEITQIQLKKGESI